MKLATNDRIEREVEIPAGDAAVLPGTLSVPGNAEGVVLFAHGSGSSRQSPRNRFVAAELYNAGIGFNRQAYALLPCKKELVVVPCASHLFEEPGALEEVARLATDWFRQHLGAAA